MQTTTPINLPKDVIRSSLKNTTEKMKVQLKFTLNLWIEKNRFECNDFFEDQDRVKADDLTDFIKKL